MNTGTLTLTISVPVRGGSYISPQAITFQGNKAAKTYSSSLTTCSR